MIKSDQYKIEGKVVGSKVEFKFTLDGEKFIVNHIGQFNASQTEIKGLATVYEDGEVCEGEKDLPFIIKLEKGKLDI
jgi:hypothetical protein